MKEDGSWDATSECRVAVAVTWDKNHDEFRIWYRRMSRALLEELKTFIKILTLNGERFDFKVLEYYGSIKELNERSVDLYAFVKRHTGEGVYHCLRCPPLSVPQVLEVTYGSRGTLAVR